MRLLLVTLLVALFGIWGVYGCKKKEGPPGPQGPAGPQGPPGQDLTRLQNGYIEGRARGKDNNGNPFDIPFRYTYYFSLGTYRFTGTNTLAIDFTREDSLGIGYLSFSFNWDRGANSVGNLSIGGTAADISQNPVPTYQVQILPSVPGIFPGTTQSVSDLSLSGDTLRGKFQYIRPTYNIPNIGTNTHPDTVSGSFVVQLIQERRYNRVSGQ